jgi:hypothetical protein
MTTTSFFKYVAAMICVLFMAGCATKTPYDYTAFKESRPKSILVLPPINNTPEVPASYSVLSYATMPLAEAGYYVMPVTMVTEAFKENGVTQPSDMHATSAEKLRQIFGADAVLYITVNKYGTVYQVFDSAAVVSADAKLIDLKTGKLLWAGSASASSNEGKSQQGGLTGMLVSAIVKQVVGTIVDESHRVAGVTTARLLYPRKDSGILYGPRSPNYGKD